MNLTPTPPPPELPLDPACRTVLGSIVRLPPYPRTQKAMLLPYCTPPMNEVQRLSAVCEVKQGACGIL